MLNQFEHIADIMKRVIKKPGTVIALSLLFLFSPTHANSLNLPVDTGSYPRDVLCIKYPVFQHSNGNWYIYEPSLILPTSEGSGDYNLNTYYINPSGGSVLKTGTQGLMLRFNNTPAHYTSRIIPPSWTYSTERGWRDVCIAANSSSGSIHNIPIDFSLLYVNSPHPTDPLIYTASYDQTYEIRQMNSDGTLAPSTPDNDNDGVLADTDPDDSDPCNPNTTNNACLAITDNDNDGIFADTDPDDNDPCWPDANNNACLTTTDQDSDGVFLINDPNDFDPCDPNPSHPSCLATIDYDSDGVFSDTDPNDLDPCDPDPNHASCLAITDNDGDLSFASVDPDDSDPCNPSTTSNACLAITDDDGDNVFANTDPDDSNPCLPDSRNILCTNSIDNDQDGVPDLIDPDNTDVCNPDPNNSLCLAITDQDLDGYPITTDPNDFDPCDPDVNSEQCLLQPTIDYDNDGVFADTDPNDLDPCLPSLTHASCLAVTDEDDDAVFADTDPDDLDPCNPSTDNQACLNFLDNGNDGTGSDLGADAIKALIGEDLFVNVLQLSTTNPSLAGIPYQEGQPISKDVPNKATFGFLNEDDYITSYELRYIYPNCPFTGSISPNNLISSGQLPYLSANTVYYEQDFILPPSPSHVSCLNDLTSIYDIQLNLLLIDRFDNIHQFVSNTYKISPPGIVNGRGIFGLGAIELTLENISSNFAENWFWKIVLAPIIFAATSLLTLLSTAFNLVWDAVPILNQLQSLMLPDQFEAYTSVPNSVAGVDLPFYDHQQYFVDWGQGFDSSVKELFGLIVKLGILVFFLKEFVFSFLPLGGSFKTEQDEIDEAERRIDRSVKAKRQYQKNKFGR